MRGRVVGGVFLALLAFVPLVAGALEQPFFTGFFIRIMIYSIAALSLGLIMAYGGMSSFGHAVYLGIGAYSVAILAHYNITSGFAHFACAVAASVVAALVIGGVSLKTSGIHFIMITLAFAQMVYFLAVSLKAYGGDDGLNIMRPSDFGSLDLGNPTVLYYVVFAVLLLFLWVGARLVDSRFGMVIRGARSNPRRMAAIGFPVFRYQLAAFVIAGAMCGVAGALYANQTLFVSPAVMHWTRSGELLIVVIVGGMGSLFGPVIGAAVYLTIEYALSGFTAHWQGIIGTALILLVLFFRAGIFGMLAGKKAAHG